MENKIRVLGLISALIVFFTQAVLYVPEAIVLRRNWLQDNASLAVQYALVLDTSDSVRENPELSKLFKSRTDIDAISAKKMG